MVFKHGPFAKRLSEMLKKRKMTQGELASRVGVSKKSMNTYCTAGCVPQGDTLAEIAHELGVSTDFLIYGGARGLEASRDDIRAIAVMAGDLEYRERNTLTSLTFSLVKGTEEIRDLVHDFAQIAHRLTADINLKRHGLWEQQLEEIRRQYKEETENNTE